MLDADNNIHSASCFAAALICAVENIRDAAIDATHSRFCPISPEAAAGEVATTDYCAVAQGYLDDGITNCRCDS